MSAVADAIITYALIHRLTTPIKDTKAFKMGLVDETGMVTEKGKSDHTEQARDALTLLDRLVFKLKRIWKLTPSLIKFTSSYAVALAALKEENECFSHLGNELTESVARIVEGTGVLPYAEIHIVESAKDASFVRKLIEAYQESPAMVEEVMAGNAVSSGQVAGLATEPVITKEKQKKIVSGANGCETGRHVVEFI